MIGVLLFLFLWPLATYLCGSLRTAVILHSLTLLTLNCYLHGGWHWLRSSALARFLGRRLMRVSVVGDALRTLDPARQHVFACAPHGPAALHLCFVFAAHGDATMSERMARRTVVVGHWLLVLLPFVCQIFQLCGVTFSQRSSFDRALDLRCDIALCPDGLDGKLAALRNPSAAPGTITIRRRERAGFVALAARKRALIVPVLSPLEHRPFGVLSCFLLLAFGAYSPCDIAVRVGQPIETSEIDADDSAQIDALTRTYYDRLVALAGDDYTINFD